MWPLIISGLAGVATASASRPRDPKEKTPIKTAIALGIGGLTAVGLYKLLKKEIKDGRDEKKNSKLFESEKEGKDLSYKPSQFITWADKINDAFSDYNFNGTDEEAIYSIMRKLKTNNDWLELNKAFGLRTYYDVFSPEYFFGKKANMITTLQMELDTQEKAKVNSILKSKGIKYRI